MMRRPTRLVLALAVLLPALVLWAWPAGAQEPVTSRFKLSIGGYIKPEFQYRTARGAVSFAGGAPGTQNFGFEAIAQKNTVGGDNGFFLPNVAETRFHFTITAPDWRGLKPLGYIEMDFDGDSATAIARQGGVAPGGGVGGYGQQVALGGFRIRHAFFRLTGEGMGGSWNVLLGQTWGLFGLIPHYLGSSVSFGGGGILAGRSVQARVQHTWNVLRDLAWENTIAAMVPSSQFQEVPAGEISTRVIYRGWQGVQGGVRSPLSAGFSARVQRFKADLFAPPAGSAVAGTASTGTRALSNVGWGISGGAFLPILPGRSATDRTWALSALSEAGYGEGVNTQIPGANPLPAAVTSGIPNRDDPGATFFHPGKCTVFAGPPTAAAVGTAATACANNGGLVLIPTELSLVKSNWVHWGTQFYLPWNFWLSGGQKYIWFHNADNASAPTCLTNNAGACLAVIGPQAGPAAGTVASGRNALGAGGAPAAGFNNASLLFAGRDSELKRMVYSYVSAFYDMTPNIRLGFEWGMHHTNRKDSAQDNQSHRWLFAGYYFF